MVRPTLQFPQYHKFAQVLVGLIALFFILFLGRDIIVPIIFAMLIAILLNPMVNYLQRKRVNRIVAIILAILSAIILVGALAYFISSQLAMFSESLPQFKEKFTTLGNDILQWLQSNFNLSKTKISGMLEDAKKQAMSLGGAALGQTLGVVGATLVVFVLLPVYVFMILFYKPMLLRFIAMLFPQDENGVVDDVLKETKILIQSYLLGLMFEMLIVAGLNTIGLLIIGIQYAVLLAIIGAILNIIPYVGGLIAMSLVVLVAFTTKSPAAAFWVIVCYGAVQLIDNNFIVPKVVGSRVKINALVSIIAVLAGSALWGIAGMFLAIPMIALCKVVFDRVESLKPFGYVLGDDQPELGKVNIKFKKVGAKKSVSKAVIGKK